MNNQLQLPQFTWLKAIFPQALVLALIIHIIILIGNPFVSQAATQSPQSATGGWGGDAPVGRHFTHLNRRPSLKTPEREYLTGVIQTIKVEKTAWPVILRETKNLQRYSFNKRDNLYTDVKRDSSLSFRMTKELVYREDLDSMNNLLSEYAITPENGVLYLVSTVSSTITLKQMAITLVRLNSRAIIAPFAQAEADILALPAVEVKGFQEAQQSTETIGQSATAPVTAIAPSPSPATVTAFLREETATVTAFIREETVTIPTYAYEDALFFETGFPYPQLNPDLVGSLKLKGYRAVILENQDLRLTFLPELGGRLYQITVKATGEDLLYNNPVIKPTHWGPLEMNWWLMVGGMEWAFPVEEHGYTWGMPWEISTEVKPDGSALTYLTYQDKATQLRAHVTVILPPSGQSFTTYLSLSNNTAAAVPGQLWVNTTLAAGPDMALDMPAQQVEVHSLGQAGSLTVGEVVPWEAEMAAWGRWSGWFSVFAAPTNRSWANMWSSGRTAGLQREADPTMAPGFKLFAWGTAGEFSTYEGEPYYEIWGGLTRDFETFATLQPGETQGWSETWTVINR